MAKRIAEVEVVAKLDSRRYRTELNSLTASTIAELDAIGREKVSVNIDIDKNELNREILRVKEKLNELDGATDKGSKGRQKQLQKYLKDLRLDMDKLNQASKEYALALKILNISEKENAREAENLRRIISDKNAVVREAVTVHKDHERAVTSDAGAMKTFRQHLRDATAEGSSFSRVWQAITLGGSKNPLETLKKTLREPVKLGPFTASVRGLLSSFAVLGPVIYGVANSLISLAAVTGSGLVGGMALGTGAVFGFGAAFGSLFMAMKPVAEEFKIIQQVTDAHTKAVLKYGASSDQAKKAQEQMNNTLKGVSPLARDAAKSLDQAKTTFSGLTGPARESMGRLMTDMAGSFNLLAPVLARGANNMAVSLQGSLSGVMQQITGAETKRGGGPIASMMRDASVAARPLITGLGNIFQSLTQIGAAASSYLPGIANTFRTWSQSVLGATSNSDRLNSAISTMMGDLRTLGNLAMGTGRWVTALFRAARGPGAGMLESITSKLNSWTRSLNTLEGQNKARDWFQSSADIISNLVSMLSQLGRVTMDYSRILSPFVAGMAALASGLAQVVSYAARLPILSQAFATLGAAVMSFAIAGRIMAMAQALGALVMAGLKIPIVETAILRFAYAFPMLTAAIETAMGPVGWFLGAVTLLAVALASTTTAKPQEEFQRLKDKADQANAAAQSLAATLGDSFSDVKMQKLNIATMQAQLLGMKQGTQEWKTLNEQIVQAQNQLEDSQGALAKKQKDLKKGRADAVKDAKAELDFANGKGRRINPYTGQEEASSVARRTQAEKDYTAALQRQAAVQAEVARARAGYNDITATTSRLIGELAMKSPALGKAAALAAPDRKSTEQITSAAALATRSGGANRSAIVYDILTNTKGADNKIKALRDLANTPAEMPVKANTTQAKFALDELSRTAGGKQISVAIATRYKDPTNRRDIAAQAQAALGAGASANVVMKLVKDPKANPAAVLASLKAQTAGQALKVGVSPNTKSASSQLSSFRAAEGKKPVSVPVKVDKSGAAKDLADWHPTVTVKTQKAKAEGGVVSAASGYQIGTAYETASRRPARKAMGAFREPTLLVGEENRTEYVIATNPAYRKANIGYLAAAAHELGVPLGITPAAGGTGPRKVLLNAILNEGIASDDKRGKAFVRKVKNKAGYFHMLEDEAAAYQTMMSNDEKRNQPGMWAAHKNARMGFLRRLLSMYRSAYSVGSRANKAKLRGMIASTEGDIMDLRSAAFAGGDQGQKDAQIAQLNAQLTSARNTATINAAFAQTAGGFMNSGGFFAAGGPGGQRLTRSSGGQTFIINTLHPGDSTTLSAIGSAAVAGFGYQGFTTSPRMVIG